MEEVEAETAGVTYLDELLPEIEVTELLSLDQVLERDPTFVAFRPEDIQKKMAHLAQAASGPTVAAFVSLHAEVLGQQRPLGAAGEDRAAHQSIPMLDLARRDNEDHEASIEEARNIYANPGFAARSRLLERYHIPVAATGAAAGTGTAFSTDRLAPGLYEVALAPQRADRVVLRGGPAGDEVTARQSGSFFVLRPDRVGSQPLADTIAAATFGHGAATAAAELDAQPSWEETIAGVKALTDMDGLTAHFELHGYRLDAATPDQMAALLLHLESLPVPEEPADSESENDSSSSSSDEEAEEPTRGRPRKPKRPQTGPPEAPGTVWQVLAGVAEKPADLSRYKEMYQALLARVPSRPNNLPDIPANVLRMAEGIRRGQFSVEDVLASLRYYRADQAFRRAKAAMEAYLASQEAQDDLPAALAEREVAWALRSTPAAPGLPLLDLGRATGATGAAALGGGFAGIATDAEEVRMGADTRGYDGNPVAQPFAVFDEQEYEGFAAEPLPPAPEVADELDSAFDEELELHKEGIGRRYVHLVRAAGLPPLSREVAASDTLPGLLGEWVVELLEASLSGGLEFDLAKGMMGALYRWSPYGPPAVSEKTAEGRGILYYLAEVSVEIGIYRGEAEGLVQQAIREAVATQPDRVGRLREKWAQLKDRVFIYQSARQAEMAFAEAVRAKRGLLGPYVQSISYLPGVLGQPLTQRFGCCLQQLGPDFRADTDLAKKKQLYQLKQRLGELRMGTIPRPRLYAPLRAVEAPPAEAPEAREKAAAAALAPEEAPEAAAPAAGVREWVAATGIEGFPGNLREAAERARKELGDLLKSRTLLGILVERETTPPQSYHQLLTAAIVLMQRYTSISSRQREAVAKVRDQLRALPARVGEKDLAEYGQAAVWLLNRGLSALVGDNPRARAKIQSGVAGWLNARQLLTMAQYQDYIAKKREDKKMAELEYMDARPEERRLLGEAKKLGLWAFEAPEDRNPDLSPGALAAQQAAGAEVVDDYEREGAAEHAPRGRDESDDEY